MLMHLFFAAYSSIYRFINRHYFFIRHRKDYHYIAVQEAYEKGDIKRFKRELKNAIGDGYGDFVGHACFGILMRSLDVETKLVFVECIVEFIEGLKYSSHDAKNMLRKMLWCLFRSSDSFQQRICLARQFLLKTLASVLERTYDGLFVLGELVKNEPSRAADFHEALNHLIIEVCLLEPPSDILKKIGMPTVSNGHAYLASFAAIQSRWDIYAAILKQDTCKLRYSRFTYGVFAVSAQHIQRSWRRYKDRRMKQTIARIVHYRNLSPQIAQVIYAHSHIKR